MQNHIKLLLKKKKRLDSIIDSLEKTIESIKEDRKMTNDEIFSPFSIVITSYSIHYTKLYEISFDCNRYPAIFLQVLIP